jgi:presenilin-like A22 family membrane protease
VSFHRLAGVCSMMCVRMYEYVSRYSTKPNIGIATHDFQLEVPCTSIHWGE